MNGIYEGGFFFVVFLLWVTSLYWKPKAVWVVNSVKSELEKKIKYQNVDKLMSRGFFNRMAIDDRIRFFLYILVFVNRYFTITTSAIPVMHAISFTDWIFWLLNFVDVCPFWKLWVFVTKCVCIRYRIGTLIKKPPARFALGVEK